MEIQISRFLLSVNASPDPASFWVWHPTLMLQSAILVQQLSSILGDFMRQLTRNKVVLALIVVQWVTFLVSVGYTTSWGTRTDCLGQKRLATLGNGESIYRALVRAACKGGLHHSNQSMWHLEARLRSHKKVLHSYEHNSRMNSQFRASTDNMRSSNNQRVSRRCE